MKTILLTGAAGTIGTALRSHLGELYHFRCLDLKPIPEIDDMWVADIADFHTVYQAMLGVDAVIHLAANPDNDQSWHDVYTSGIGGTYNVFETARRGGIRKIIYASSCHVLGAREIWQKKYATPDMPAHPNSLYGAGKLFGEVLGRFFVEYHNMSVICLRIGAFYETLWQIESSQAHVLSAWCSARDLAQLVKKSLETDGLGFQIFYGVSNNTRRFWDIGNAQKLVGYQPQDNAEVFLEKPLKSAYIKGIFRNRGNLSSLFTYLRHSSTYSLLSDKFYTLAGHADYGKFVIIASPCSGANFLVSSLNSHPNICCYYEIFHPNEFVRRTNQYFPTNQKLHTLFVKHPARFLKENFFSRHYSKQVLWVGFEIFYQHTRQTGQISIWPYLTDNKELKIIHVQRKNVLAQYLLLTLARQTGVWSSQIHSDYQQHLPLTLHYEHCLEYFKEIESYRQETEQLFYKHDKVNIYYEDLLSNLDMELTSIQDFLELPHQKLNFGLQQQNLQTFSQCIKNYEELKRKFADSKYSHFFVREFT